MASSLAQGDALEKLEYLSFVSKVSSELKSHIGFADKVLGQPANFSLCSPVIADFNISTKDQQKWWKRTQFIDPFIFLNPHPFLNLPCVITLSPFPQIHNHHTRVEITGFLKNLEKFWV
ncbi:hypothetical protein V6N13_125385 [Hibiscus sabdariffa]|uniref:Uncharacterized protein n=1 Tax=Hibiscus sabdariffa TaxID=183260 RepID=A0ABR2U5G4_9ROSI